MRLYICGKCGASFYNRDKAITHFAYFHPDIEVVVSEKKVWLLEWIIDIIINKLALFAPKLTWDKMEVIAREYKCRVIKAPDCGFFPPDLIAVKEGKEQIFWHELGHATMPESSFLQRPYLWGELLATLKGYLLSVRWFLEG